MCFEYESGTEDRAYSNPSESGNIQRRPRVCSHDETKNDDNNCICYIIQAAGQSGPKQTPDGAGFRPEIDYLEVCVEKYFGVRSIVHGLEPLGLGLALKWTDRSV